MAYPPHLRILPIALCLVAAAWITFEVVDSPTHALENDLFFLLTATGGYASSTLMKQLIQRERPSIVPHLSHVGGSNSFPSTHAVMAVVVYVTIGLLLMQRKHDRHLRRLMIVLPLWLATLIGVSRVCMGVHYPTDVLAGWSSGLLWTWLAFLIRGRLRKSE